MVKLIFLILISNLFQCQVSNLNSPDTIPQKAILLKEFQIEANSPFFSENDEDNFGVPSIRYLSENNVIYLLADMADRLVAYDLNKNETYVQKNISLLISEYRNKYLGLQNIYIRHDTFYLGFLRGIVVAKSDGTVLREILMPLNLTYLGVMANGVIITGIANEFYCVSPEADTVEFVGTIQEGFDAEYEDFNCFLDDNLYTYLGNSNLWELYIDCQSKKIDTLTKPFKYLNDNDDENFFQLGGISTKYYYWQNIFFDVKNIDAHSHRQLIYKIDRKTDELIILKIDKKFIDLNRVDSRFAESGINYLISRDDQIYLIVFQKPYIRIYKICNLT